VVGMMINSLFRHSQRVRIACLAQLVNVIAPIMTEPGGPVWKQTMYYPFYYAARFGKGIAMNLFVTGEYYQNQKYGRVPCIDAAAVYNEEEGTVSCFIINRDIENPQELKVVLEHFSPLAVDQQFIMQHPDSRAENSAEYPEEVVPVVSEVFSLRDNVVQGVLPPLCWCFILLKSSSNLPD